MKHRNTNKLFHLLKHFVCNFFSGLTVGRNELPTPGPEDASSFLRRQLADHSRVDEEGEVGLRAQAAETKASDAVKVIISFHLICYFV
jgi:hypothetical protein